MLNNRTLAKRRLALQEQYQILVDNIRQIAVSMMGYERMVLGAMLGRAVARPSTLSFSRPLSPSNEETNELEDSGDTEQEHTCSQVSDTSVEFGYDPNKISPILSRPASTPNSIQSLFQRQEALQDMSKYLKKRTEVLAEHVEALTWELRMSEGQLRMLMRWSEIADLIHGVNRSQVNKSNDEEPVL